MGAATPPVVPGFIQSVKQGFGLPRIDAFHLGFLLGVLSKTVCILGELLGVDAFDHPGVEESKEYARAMLGKAGKGYDELREKVARAAGGEQEA